MSDRLRHLSRPQNRTSHREDRVLHRRSAVALSLMLAALCAAQTPANSTSGATQSSPSTLPVFTPDSLAHFDGKDGHPAYVAVSGRVYDLTSAKSWKGGAHEEHVAGRDLTNEIVNTSPHGIDALEKFPLVGRMAGPSAAPAADTGEIVRLKLERSLQQDRRFRIMKAHKALAFTTAGLLLAADGLGVAHLVDLIQQGHAFRDSIGFSEDGGNEADRTRGIKQAWYRPNSQAFRALHGATVALATIGYTATATMELSAPRTGAKVFSWKRGTHRGLFYLHAACMAANIGLGFVETWGLSQGNHNIAGPLGVAHAIVGVAAPLLIISSGIVYNKPQ